MNNIKLIIILGLLYLITGKISLELLSGHEIVNVGVFTPEGIALAFAIYYGTKIWPGIFIGQFLLAYSNSMGFLTSFEVSVINSLEAILASTILTKLNFNKNLISFRDFFTLFLAITVILQPFSAILSNIFLVLNNHISSDEYFISTFSWWFGNVMGQFLFTPFVLLLFRYIKKINTKKFIIITIFFTLYVVILNLILKIENPFLLISLTLPVIIIILSYKGIFYGSLLSVIVSIIASISAYKNIGAFSINDDFTNALNYNLFILAHILIVLTVGILFEEKKNYEKKLKETIRKEVEKNQKQQLYIIQQSRLAQMGEMISMIAHQWRQPLNNLSLLNQLIINKYYKNKLDDKAIEYFKENSKKYINFLSNTIDDFRNFYKEDKQKENVTFNEIVTYVLEMVKPSLENNNISVELDLNSDVVFKTYKNELRQVLLNLIKNAEDAIVENKIQNPKIKIITQDNILMIKDNAGGIPQDIMDKIFDPYFSTKSKNGTGLGLYMSKMIIEEHCNGKLETYNSTDGAVFKIALNQG